MHALDRAVSRLTAPAKTTAKPRKSEAETLWVALRADRRSRDERTARLRAMALAADADPTA